MMEKLPLLFLWTLILSITVSAVTIHSIDIQDTLYIDSSMTESIIINISNNTDKEFSLTLPEKAISIIANGTLANNIISDEIACEQCVVEIIYSFPEIVINDSGFNTFYRKIDVPMNARILRYSIVIPENHSLISMTELSASIIPTPDNIIDNRTFEWTFDDPEFPIDFGVRYVEIPAIEEDKDVQEVVPLKEGTPSYIIFVILIVLLIAGFIIGLYWGSKKKR